MPNTYWLCGCGFRACASEGTQDMTHNHGDSHNKMQQIEFKYYRKHKDMKKFVQVPERAIIDAFGNDYKDPLDEIKQRGQLFNKWAVYQARFK